MSTPSISSSSSIPPSSSNPISDGSTIFFHCRFTARSTRVFLGRGAAGPASASAAEVEATGSAAEALSSAASLRFLDAARAAPKLLGGMGWVGRGRG